MRGGDDVEEEVCQATRGRSFAMGSPCSAQNATRGPINQSLMVDWSLMVGFVRVRDEAKPPRGP